MRWWTVVLRLVAMIAAQAGRAGEPESAVIPDTNLRVAVEAALGIQDPTAADFLQLTQLSCTYAGIRDLTGLDLARNLVHLDLQGSRSPMKAVVKEVAGSKVVVELAEDRLAVARLQGVI